MNGEISHPGIRNGLYIQVRILHGCHGQFDQYQLAVGHGGGTFHTETEAGRFPFPGHYARAEV